MSYYAHSLEGQPPEKWETMAEHETAVANLCAGFLKRIHPSLEPWGVSLRWWNIKSHLFGQPQISVKEQQSI
jgi:hypothetical protein